MARRAHRLRRAVAENRWAQPAVVVSALVVVVGLAAWVVVRDGDSHEPSATTSNERSGERSAERACDRFGNFVAIAMRNGAAAEANAALDDAVDAAREAAQSDPRWVQLASGTQALRVAFDEDDPDATRLGLEVVRSQCPDI